MVSVFISSAIQNTFNLKYVALKHVYQVSSNVIYQNSKCIVLNDVLMYLDQLNLNVAQKVNKKLI